MDRQKLLSDTYVCQFTKWLSLRLDSSELSHGWFSRRVKKWFFFDSLFDAYSQFCWPFECTLPDGKRVRGRLEKDTTEVLDTLSDSIRMAIADKDNDFAKRCCISILEWGGVTAKNKDWIQSRASSLISILLILKNIIRNEQIDKAVQIERYNSGMSKICSLMVDDYIIYDSRVAAAFGMLITKFCQDSSISTLPSSLVFPRMNAKEASKAKNPKNRNPSADNLSFPLIKQGAAYLIANMRASWILDATVKQAIGSQFQDAKNPLKALEAALFMYGYDLGVPGFKTKNAESKSESDQSIFDKRKAVPSLKDDDFPLITRGVKGVSFRAGYDAGSATITLYNHHGRADVFSINEIYQIIVDCYSLFNDKWFPLANNVEKLGNNNEKEGLGKSILKQRPGNTTHAQAASYLGPFLEHIGIFKWNQKRKGICWKIVTMPRRVEELKATIREKI